MHVDQVAGRVRVLQSLRTDLDIFLPRREDVLRHVGGAARTVNREVLACGPSTQGVKIRSG